MLGKSPKVSGKDLLPFQRYLPEATKEGEKPQTSNLCKISMTRKL